MGIELSFQQNPSTEELDQIFRRLDDYKTGIVPVKLQPGDSVVKQFVLRSRKWLFVSPHSVVPTGWTVSRINTKRVSDAKKPLFYVMQWIMLGRCLIVLCLLPCRTGHNRDFRQDDGRRLGKTLRSKPDHRRTLGGDPILVKLCATGDSVTLRSQIFGQILFHLSRCLERHRILNIRTARESSRCRTSLRPRLIFDLACDSGTDLRPPIPSSQRRRMALPNRDLGSTAESMSAEARPGRVV